VCVLCADKGAIRQRVGLRRCDSRAVVSRWLQVYLIEPALKYTRWSTSMTLSEHETDAAADTLTHRAHGRTLDDVMQRTDLTMQQQARSTALASILEPLLSFLCYMQLLVLK